MEEQLFETDAIHRCVLCEYKATFDFQLDYHIQTAHSATNIKEMCCVNAELRTHLCTSCRFQSSNKLELLQHCKDQHEPRNEDRNKSGSGVKLVNGSSYEHYIEYLCKIRNCNYTSNSSLSFLKHCDSCNQVPTESASLLQAAASSRNNTPPFILGILIPVNISMTKIPILEQSRTQLDVDKPIKTYYCTECPYRARRIHHLNRHTLRHHPENKRPENSWFCCTKCPYRTRLMRNLDLHKCNTYKEGPWCVEKRDPAEISLQVDGMYSCDKCSYIANKMTTILNHNNKRHSTPKEINSLKSSGTKKLQEDLKMHMKTRMKNLFGSSVLSALSKQNSNSSQSATCHGKGQQVQENS